MDSRRAMAMIGRSKANIAFGSLIPYYHFCIMTHLCGSQAPVCSLCLPEVQFTSLNPIPSLKMRYIFCQGFQHHNYFIYCILLCNWCCRRYSKQRKNKTGACQDRLQSKINVRIMATGCALQNKNEVFSILSPPIQPCQTREWGWMQCTHSIQS